MSITTPESNDRYVVSLDTANSGSALIAFKSCDVNVTFTSLVKAVWFGMWPVNVYDLLLLLMLLCD